jgi:hypothetical protein
VPAKCRVFCNTPDWLLFLPPSHREHRDDKTESSPCAPRPLNRSRHTPCAIGAPRRSHTQCAGRRHTECDCDFGCGQRPRWDSVVSRS